MQTFAHTLFQGLDKNQRQDNVVVLNGMLQLACEHFKHCKPQIAFAKDNTLRSYANDPKLLQTLDYVQIELKVSTSESETFFRNNGH
jgi:hypothetical protein